MYRSRLSAILILVLMVAGVAAARTLTRPEPESNSERLALQSIQSRAEMDIAERTHRLSTNASEDEVSEIRSMKRQMYIDLLEAKQSFARERGDTKTEEEALAALEFWTRSETPVLSESPQPFDKNEEGKKP